MEMDKFDECYQKESPLGKPFCTLAEFPLRLPAGVLPLQHVGPVDARRECEGPAEPSQGLLNQRSLQNPSGVRGLPSFRPEFRPEPFRTKLRSGMMFFGTHFPGTVWLEVMVKTTIEGLNRKIAFLKPGWWLVHLAGVAAVYAIGRLLAGS